MRGRSSEEKIQKRHYKEFVRHKGFFHDIGEVRERTSYCESAKKRKGGFTQIEH